MDKTKTIHYDPIPYNMQTKKCWKYHNDEENNINGKEII
jgi:hypothetical protein